MAQNSSPVSGSKPILMVVYWAIVAVPLGWGVYKTVQKSIPLFTGTSASAPASAFPTPSAATPAPLANTPAPVATDPTLAAPLPDASPFSTAQPSATVAPINPPATPSN